MLRMRTALLQVMHKGFLTHAHLVFASIFTNIAHKRVFLKIKLRRHFKNDSTLERINLYLRASACVSRAHSITHSVRVYVSCKGRVKWLLLVCNSFGDSALLVCKKHSARRADRWELGTKVLDLSIFKWKTHSVWAQMGVDSACINVHRE
jgi:hypothetical protein